MASPAFLQYPEAIRRKPPASEQFNWISGAYDVLPEQLDLDLPVLDDAILPDDSTVTLLATENGAQLLVAGFGLYIGKKGERIVVKKSGKVCAQIPFMRAQEVIIASRGVSFSSDLLEELCARGIRVGCMTSSGRPVALITSPLLTATVETRRRQLAATDNERGAEFCRWIVAGKLHNQEKLLRYFGKSRDGARREALDTTATTLRRLRKDALAVEGSSCDAVRGTLMGLEGTGGRMYWQRIGDMLPDELGFAGRHHQGPGDAVNAALNYGYGILYTHVWGAVMNAGLEPFAGFMHVDRSGKPSMVLDMVEEFRQPVVDRSILTWLNKGGRLGLTKGMLDADAKENVAARVLLRMNATERHRGKNHEVRSIIQMQARLSDPATGLSGKLDLLLRGEKTAAVVDFKLTSGELGENHRMQLAGYAVLVERVLGLSVPMTFLFRIPDNKVIAVPVTDELRQRVSQGVTAIRNMRESQELPEPTPVRARCVECEYANYCGDVW